jgi:hypothetical protein
VVLEHGPLDDFCWARLRLFGGTSSIDARRVLISYDGESGP